MKKIIGITATVLWICSTSLTLAQNSTASFTQPKSRMAGTRNSNIHHVNQRLRAQLRQIHKDLRDGKINHAQAVAAREKIKTIRKQELEFFRQNSQKEITVEQKRQLDAKLDEAGAPK